MRPPSLPGWVLLVQLAGFASPWFALFGSSGKRSKIPLDFALAALAASVLIMVLAWAATRNAARRRGGLIANAGEVSIGAASPGYVALKGVAKALPGTATADPGVGAACAWRLRSDYRGSPNRRDSGGLLSRTSSGPFLLEDFSGSCIVDPSGAEYHLPVFQKVEDKSWHTIQYIPAGATICAVGELRAAGRTPGPGAIASRRLGKPGDGRPFLLLAEDRSELLERYEKLPRAFAAVAAAWLCIVWGIVFAAFVRY